MSRLASFATFLKDRYIKELASENLRILLSLDIPLMRQFSHLNPQELLTITELGLVELLSDLERGTQLDKAQESIRKWEKNETTGIYRDQVEVADLIYLYASQKQSLIYFLPEFTSNIGESIGIMRELENYYSEVQAITLNSLVRIHAEELGESEKQFRILAENSTDMIIRAAPNGGLLYVSPSSEQLLGCKPIELLGKTVFDFVMPDDAEELRRNWKKIIDSPEIFTLTYRCIKKDGSTVWLESTIRAFLDEEGQPSEIHSASRNITERKKSEEDILSRETLLNETQHIAKLGSWEWKLMNNELTWSDEHYRLYGFEPGLPITYDMASEVALPEDKGITMTYLKNAMENRTPVDFYHRICKPVKNGHEIRILHVRAEPVFDESGAPVKFRGTSQDVTELKNTEVELKTKNEQLSDAQKIAHIGYWEWDLSTDMLTWSDEMYRIFDMEPGAMTISLDSFISRLTPESAASTQTEIRKSLDTHSPFDVYQNVVMEDGTVKIIHGIGNVVLNDQGMPIRLRGTAQDMTLQKRTEEEIQKLNRELESRLYFLAESMPQKVWTADADGSRNYFNRRWLEYTGLDAAQLNGWEWAGIVHPADRDADIDAWRKSISTGEIFSHEQRLRRADGEYRWHLGRAQAMRNAAGEITLWVGTNTDIHEQKIAAELLEQRVKERTKELNTANLELEKSNTDLLQFASVASHDLKEPLRKIQTFGSLLESRYKDNLEEEGIYYLNKVTDGAGRMQNLINDLLTFSRLSNTTTSFEKTDLNELLNEIIRDIEITIKEKDARFYIEPLPEIEVIAGQMRQVFQNIILNSLKFSRKESRPEIRIYSEKKGENCNIFIEDNGIGFEEKYLEKIFTIFQRLHPREEYEGTGIGLAICKKVVENHNGSITAQSSPGRGATFIISLPLKQNAKKWQ